MDTSVVTNINPIQKSHNQVKNSDMYRGFNEDFNDHLKNVCLSMIFSNDSVKIEL